MSKEEAIEETITLKVLYAVFSKLKGVPYGLDVQLGDTFAVDSEMLYNLYQKELNVQAGRYMN